MRDLPRMPEGVGNGTLRRNKQFSISGPEDGLLRAQAWLQDGQHTMSMSLMVNGETMEVVKLEAAIDASPHDACTSALEGLQKLVGMRIQPGLFRDMKSRVGGAKGCIHMNELIRESLQLVAAHYQQTCMRRMLDEERPIEEIFLWADEVRTWTCAAAPEPVARPKGDSEAEE